MAVVKEVKDCFVQSISSSCCYTVVRFQYSRKPVFGETDLTTVTFTWGERVPLAVLFNTCAMDVFALSRQQKGTCVFPSDTTANSVLAYGSKLRSKTVLSYSLRCIKT